MENNYTSLAESDDTEDDDDEEAEKTSKKKTTKIPRIGGISFSADKQPIASRKEEKVASLIDSLFKEKKETKEEDEAEEATETEDATTPEPEKYTAVTDEDSSETVLTADSLETETSEPREDDLVLPEPVVRDETISEVWAEGDLDEDNEISFHDPPKIETSDHVEPESESESEEDYEVLPAVSDGDGEGPPTDEPEAAAEEEPEPEPVHTSHSGPSRDRGYSSLYEPSRRTPDIDTRDIEAELNDAEYYGTRRGQRRGVLAGLLAGVYLGHRGKKKLAKAHTKEIKSLHEEIAELKKAPVPTHEHPQPAVQTIERIIQANTPKHAENRPTAPLEASRALLEAPATMPLLEMAAAPSKERYPVANATSKEHLAVVDEKRHTKELPPEEREISEETYTPRDGRRIETSSWHRIEVDTKTGHAVENPDIEYGEEFRRETRKEILAAAKDDAQAAAVQLGNMATTGSSMGGSSAPPASSAPSGSPQASGSIPTSLRDVDIPESVKASPKPKQASMARDPIIWMAAVALVVILIILASLI